MKSKTKRSPPASIGTPLVMQDMRTGEGTSVEEETSRNDDTGLNPSGSSLSDKSGRDFNEQRSKGKNRENKKQKKNIKFWYLKCQNLT